MDPAGSRTESLLASGRGAGVGVMAGAADGAVAIVASTGDVVMAAGATTEADAPSPVAEVIAVGSVTVTPVVVDVPSTAVDVASVVAVAASVVADMPSVEAEAEAVMVVDAGRFRHNSKLSRPTAFAVGRLVGTRIHGINRLRLPWHRAGSAVLLQHGHRSRWFRRFHGWKGVWTVSRWRSGRAISATGGSGFKPFSLAGNLVPSFARI